MENNILENDNSIIKYLDKKKIFDDIKMIKSIRLGASGANIFEVTDNNTRYIVKHSRYDSNSDSIEMSPDYKKEMEFYSNIQKYNLINTPEVIYIESKPSFGNIVVLKYYQPIHKDAWNQETILKAIDSCAKLHSHDIEIVKSLDIEFNELTVDKTSLDTSFEEWKKLLENNRVQTNKNELENIYTNFDLILNMLNDLPHNICHGDFHAENILMDSDEIVVCDWQNISIGKGASDIAFFISRGEAEGIAIDEDGIIDHYCERLSIYTSSNIKKNEILNVINSSKVYVSFIHWPYYLNGSSNKKIAGVYNKMIEAMDAIKFPN